MHTQVNNVIETFDLTAWKMKQIDCKMTTVNTQINDGQHYDQMVLMVNESLYFHFFDRNSKIFTCNKKFNITECLTKFNILLTVCICFHRQRTLFWLGHGTTLKWGTVTAYSTFRSFCTFILHSKRIKMHIYQEIRSVVWLQTELKLFT